MNSYRTDSHVSWRFTVDGRIIYFETNLAAWKYYSWKRDVASFKIEARTNQGWKYVTNYIISDSCQCGRSYTLANDEIFRFQEAPAPLTIALMSETFCSPLLCIMCYYKNELKVGRWAPKAIRRELGLET